MKTSLPGLAKRSATARPSPLEPPVTQMATASGPRDLADDLLAHLHGERHAEALDDVPGALAHLGPLGRRRALVHRLAAREDHLRDAVVRRLAALEAVGGPRRHDALQVGDRGGDQYA